MNIELLEKAKHSIMGGPFDMSTWQSCIGCHVMGGRGNWSIQQVQDLLGIDREAAQRLFHLSCWPIEFLEGYTGQQILKGQQSGTDWAKRIGTDKPKACARIDFFIATNGTDETSNKASNNAIEEPETVPERELVGV